MNQNLLKKNIIGRYIQISPIDFPLRKLKNVFSQKDLYYIFGERISEEHFLEEIENDTWSTHLIFMLHNTLKIVGYLRVITVNGVVEIHGGGLNKTTVMKLALSEAWALIIETCFKHYEVAKINTSCMINNSTGFKFIVRSGFKEINREIDENRINFTLTFNDFKSNKLLQRLINPAGNNV